MNDSSLSISTISLRFAGRHELLLRDWQRFYQQQLPNPAEHNCHLPEFWAVAMFDELAHNEPDTTWLLILELIRQPLGDDAFGCLAAGPLRNLSNITVGRSSDVLKMRRGRIEHSESCLDGYG